MIDVGFQKTQNQTIIGVDPAVNDGSAHELGAGDRLLLLCAHLERTPAREGELRRLLDAGLDWEDVVGRARAHAIHTHLYHHLHALGAEGVVSPDLWDRLWKTCAFDAARNMAQRSQASRVLRALHTAGIDVIPLKALALWDTVYPHPALRLSADVDILVPPGAVAQAARCLEDLGYVQHSGAQPREYKPRHMHHMLPYRLPAHPIRIEIHWNLAPPWHGYRIDVDGRWRRSVPGSIAGCAVQFLSAEDMLLHLCIHTAAGSRFLDGLRHLMDIAETTRAYSSIGAGIDWDLLAARADAWGVRPLVYLALRVADDLLGIERLHDRMAGLQPASFPPDLVAATHRRVLDIAPDMPESMIHPTADGLFHSLHAAPLAARLRLLVQLLFLPHAEMAVRYGVPAGSPRLFASYLRQPLNVMRRWVGTFAQHLARSDPGIPTPADHDEEQVLLDHWLRWQRLPGS